MPDFEPIFLDDIILMKQEFQIGSYGRSSLLAASKKDDGIRIENDRLFWRERGQEKSAPVSTITGLKLNRIFLPLIGKIYNCRIGFADGSFVNVHSMSPSGLAPRKRRIAYMEFATFLHRRLANNDSVTFEMIPAGGVTTLQMVALVFLFTGVPKLLQMNRFGPTMVALGLMALLGGVAGLQFALSRTSYFYKPDNVPDSVLPKNK